MSDNPLLKYTPQKNPLMDYVPQENPLMKYSPSLQERVFAPISKQLTGKSVGERTNFLNKAANQMTKQDVGRVSQSPQGTFSPNPQNNTLSAFMKLLPAATMQAVSGSRIGVV